MYLNNNKKKETKKRNNERQEVKIKIKKIKQILIKCYGKFPGRVFKGANSTGRVSTHAFSCFFRPTNFSFAGWSFNTRLGLCGDL